MTVLLVFAGLVKGTPITYTDFFAAATGSLGGILFTNAPITLTLVGDTAQVTGTGAGFWANRLGTFTVEVGHGIGTATFTDDIQVFDNQSAALAGFYDIAAGVGLGTFDSAFASYDLSRSIGPISGSIYFQGNGRLSTTRGALTLIDVRGFSDFTATLGTVPEPTAFAITAVGLMVMFAPRFSGLRRPAATHTSRGT